MSHIDEGQLHAWLDRERSGLSVAEAAGIEAHCASCAECGLRLMEAQRVHSRSTSILGSGATILNTARPDFAEIVARSGRATTVGVSETAGSERVVSAPVRTRRFRTAVRPLVALAWAASIVAAVGLGWLTRDLFRADDLALETSTVDQTDVATEPPSMPGLPTLAPVAAEEARSSGDVVGNPPGGLLGLAAGIPSQEAASPSAGAAALSSEPPPASVRVEDFSAIGRAGGVGSPSIGSAAGRTEEPPQLAGGAGAVNQARVARAAPLPSVAEMAGGVPVSVRGKVTDAAGNPLAGARVALSGSNTGTVTGPDGTYSFAVPATTIPQGTPLTLTSTMLGFSSQTTSARPDASNIVSANFQLPLGAIALESVVAVGYGTQTRASTSGNVSRENVAGRTALVDSPPAPGAEEARAGSAAGAADRVAPAAAAPASPPPPPPASPVWVPVSRTEADRRLGASILTIGRLPVRSIALRSGDGDPVVRVEQTLPGGGTLVLTERIGAFPPATSPVPPGTAVVTARSGSIYLEAVAPLPRAEIVELVESAR